MSITAGRVYVQANPELGGFYGWFLNDITDTGEWGAVREVTDSVYPFLSTDGYKYRMFVPISITVDHGRENEILWRFEPRSNNKRLEGTYLVAQHIGDLLYGEGQKSECVERSGNPDYPFRVGNTTYRFALPYKAPKCEYKIGDVVRKDDVDAMVIAVNNETREVLLSVGKWLDDAAMSEWQKME